jgi:hypothetical protein
MNQNCGRKLENGNCMPISGPRGAIDTERGYLQLKNGLEKKFRIYC